MRRLSVLLLGALVASLFGLAPAGAAEFVVHPGESIQAALEAAPPGSTIKVRDGVYREAVTVIDDGTEVRASGAVLEPPTTPPPPGPCTDPEDPAALTGFCVLGDVDFDSGAVSDPIEDVTISGFTVRGFAGSGAFVAGGKDVKIWHNDLVDNGEYGAAAFFSTGTNFTENRATGSEEAGLYIGSSPNADAKVQDNVVRGNAIGIFIRDADFGRIRENLAEENCVGMLFLDTGDPSGTASFWRVRDNRVRDNTRLCPANEKGPSMSGAGIAIVGATKLRIEDNRVRRNVPSGPSPFVAGGIVAVAGEEGGGIPTDNVIRENVVLDNQPADLRSLAGDADWRNNRCRTSEPPLFCAPRVTRQVEGASTGTVLLSINGGVTTFTGAGTIHFTHLGSFTYRFEGSYRPDGVPEITTIYEKSNGDTFTTFAPVEPFSPGLDYNEGVIGGTGRFANATGTLTEIFNALGPDPSDPSNPLAFTQTFRSRGTISY